MAADVRNVTLKIMRAAIKVLSNWCAVPMVFATRVLMTRNAHKRTPIEANASPTIVSAVIQQRTPGATMLRSPSVAPISAADHARVTRAADKA